LQCVRPTQSSFLRSSEPAQRHHLSSSYSTVLEPSNRSACALLTISFPVHLTIHKDTTALSLSSSSTAVLSFLSPALAVRAPFFSIATISIAAVYMAKECNCTRPKTVRQCLSPRYEKPITELLFFLFLCLLLLGLLDEKAHERRDVCIVVLGGGVDISKESHLPPWTELRVQKAVELYHAEILKSQKKRRLKGYLRNSKARPGS
jgi:hypothetical protein